jgi:zinc protease
VEAALDAVIAEVSEHGIAAEELERAKTRLIADSVYAQDNQATKRTGTAPRSPPARRWRRWPCGPKRLQGVTADAVRKAARAWLDKRRSVTGYLIKELPSTEKRS